MDDIILLFIQAAIAFAIAGAYAMIRMALFGDSNDMPIIESLIVFWGSIALSIVIMDKFLGQKIRTRESCCEQKLQQVTLRRAAFGHRKGTLVQILC